MIILFYPSTRRCLSLIAVWDRLAAMSGEATDAAPAESVAPARSTLAQAVIAVRQERNFLQSALAEERAAHSETALQLQSVRAQLIEERELVRPASSRPALTFCCWLRPTRRGVAPPSPWS